MKLNIIKYNYMGLINIGLIGCDVLAVMTAVKAFKLLIKV